VERRREESPKSVPIEAAGRYALALGLVVDRPSSGHDVVRMARRADRLEALAQRLREQRGVSARVLIAHLSEKSGIDAVTSSIQSESELAALVNDAGFSGMARSGLEVAVLWCRRGDLNPHEP
jgi:short-subunit dehydrogenase